MTEDSLGDDLERLELGLNPLQDEVLDDLDDLRRVLRRLGHDLDRGIVTTHWEEVEWECPTKGCHGTLVPVDTRVRGLPTKLSEFDTPVSINEVSPHTLCRARTLTLPIVYCTECRYMFQPSFRRLLDPDERKLPEPRIVETPDTLSGRPRIDGTRIGVEHIQTFYERGYTAGEIARQVYPTLTEAHVQAAIDWGEANPEALEAIERENEETKLRHDLLQEAVEAGVEEAIDTLWTVLVNARSSEDGDPVLPVTSALRNGFERTDRLDVEVDTDGRRVILHVGDLLGGIEDHGKEPLPEREDREDSEG